MVIEPHSEDHLDPKDRTLEKQRSREADERALASGRISSAELRAENEVFVRLGSPGRIDFAAARRLA